MMNKPIPPCKDCKDRNVEYCLICPRWQAYAIERGKYYDYTYSQNSVKSAWLERFPKALRRAINFKNKTLK